MESTNIGYNSTENLVHNAIEVFNSLSTEKMKEAFNFISYLKDKEEWEATVELSSPEILDQIQKGLTDLNSGNFVNFEDIKKNV